MDGLKDLDRDRLERVTKILAKKYKKVLDSDDHIYTFVFLEMVDPFFPDSHIAKYLEKKIYIVDLEDERIEPAYVKENIIIAPAKIIEAERIIRIYEDLYIVEYARRLKGYFQYPGKPRDPEKLSKYEVLYGFYDISEGIYLVGPFCFENVLVRIDSEYGYNYDNWEVRIKKGKKWVNLGTIVVSTVDDMLEVIFYCNKLRELVERKFK